MMALPGFPDAPLWVFVWIVVVGLALLYFGKMGRGVPRVVAVTIALALLAYAAAPSVERFLHDHPQIIACTRTMAATQSLHCDAAAPPDPAAHHH